MMDEPIATMVHVRACGFCARGVRQFSDLHGLDLHRFCSEGLPVSILEATGDALAMAVAAKARDEVENG